MLFRPNPSSGVPIYLQLMEQVKHAIETGALRPGEQLPGIRPLAEELVINPNTVAKAYRELEHEGVIELRHGAGAFVSAQRRAQEADRQAPRRTGGRRGSRRAAAGARGHRRGDPAAVRSRAGGAAQDRKLEDIVAEAFAIETTDLREALRRRRGAARPGPAGARRLDLRLSRQERRRQDHDASRCCSAWRGRRAARRACSACAADDAGRRASRSGAAPASSARKRISTTT